MKSIEILKLYPTSPLSDALLKFIDSNSDFESSLKLSTYPRFIFIPRIILSYPLHFDDEIIGMFYFDTQERFFKQDYVVNVDFKHKNFISYSRMSNSITENDRVKGIDAFFGKYGKWDGQKGEFYCRDNHTKPWMHHYSRIDELPDDQVLRNLAKDISGKY